MKYKREYTDADALTRRRFIKGSAGAVIAAGLLPSIDLRGMKLGPQAPQDAVKKAYVCPPCGQDCDKLTFDKPGTCPQCGMKLIPAGGEKDEISPSTVAVLLFNSVEIIDFAGPWEVFGGAGYKVFSVAEKLDPVTTVYGQKITADYTFESSPKADVLLIPGGGVKGTANNPSAIKWVQDKAKESKYVMSVCTGAFILAKAGLLDGLFTRRFKDVFGTTPAAFVKDLRLREARERLTLPNQTVESVADSVGFNSADAFRRAFERRYGLQPTSYRKHFSLRVESALRFTHRSDNAVSTVTR